MIWDLINEYPATVLAGEADLFFAEAVMRRSRNVVIHPMPDAKSGIRTRDQIRAVGEGRFAMASSFAGALADESPAFLLSSLPFVTQSTSDARTLTELALPLYKRLLAERNQKLIYVSPWPPTGLWSARAVPDRDALGGLKVRTYDKLSTEVFAQVAASASVMSFADLPPKLASGKIDTVLSSGDGDAGPQLWTRLKFFSAIVYAVPLSFGTVHRGAWDKLDVSDRETILEAGCETTEHQWAAMTAASRAISPSRGRTASQSRNVPRRM